MAKKAVSTYLENPGILLVTTYVVLLLVNVVILYFANLFFPNQVVLGTMNISMAWAILHSMGALSLIAIFALPFFREFEKNRGRMLTSKEWMLSYFLVNAVGVWLISRASDQFGLGVSGWYIVIALAIVLAMFQGVAMMQLEKYRQS